MRKGLQCLSVSQECVKMFLYIIVTVIMFLNFSISCGWCSEVCESHTHGASQFFLVVVFRCYFSLKVTVSGTSKVHSDDFVVFLILMVIILQCILVSQWWYSDVCKSLNKNALIFFSSEQRYFGISQIQIYDVSVS